MSNTTQVNNGGIGFCGLLTIVFITLKLTDTVDWSWPWVLSPILIPLALAAIILTCVGFVMLWVILKQSGGKYQ